MEVNTASQLYSQDSLAAEMLNKLQSGSAAGFASVAVPEGLSLQPPHVGSSLVSASSSVLNPSLLSQTMGQNPGSAEGIILNAAGSLDPALTQLLVAAQTGSSSVGGVSTALVPNVAVTCPPTSMHGLQPVLSASLPAPPAPIHSSDLALQADPSPTVPTSVANHEAMTITVHCTMSDTVIVVGQQNWQCCMCREICGFESSIDQHLSLKHNLCLKPVEEEGREMLKGSGTVGGVTHSDGKACAENKTSAHQVFPSLPDSALASTQNTDSSNSRSGLEREVALLMAQTFTHSGSMDITEETKHQDSSMITSVSSEKQSDAVPFTDIISSKNTNKGLPSPAVEKTDTADDLDTYVSMIDKVERAILCTDDAVAKNDLLLVATELARIQKDLTSKRRQMKKTHRYIPCPECGKEVRNRKDLIKQHNRCHEKTKKYRCLVCNRMFKYMHTLRRHVVQQNHHGGLPGKVNTASSPSQDTNDLSATEDVSFQGLKLEVDECDQESEMIINIDFGSLSSDTPVVSTHSKGNTPQELGEPAYEKILAALLSKGEQNRTPSGRKQSLLQCFVCDREIRNRNYYITRHARCHMEDLCYTCSVCGMEFYRSDYYRQHMTQHGSQPSLKDYDKSSTPENNSKSCELNQNQSSNKPKKRNNPKLTTVMCRICDKEIYNRTCNIKRHARQHSIMEWELIVGSPRHAETSKSENKPSASGQHFLHCGLCGLKFHNYARKRLHLLTHRSTFQCRLCDAKLDSGAELLTHSQNCKKKGSEGAVPGDSKGGDPPEGNSTQDGNGLVVASNQNSRGPTWKKQATGQAPSPRKWTCPICQASIIHTLPSISRHMRELHSEGQPHHCPKCNRTYSSYHKMQRHLKSHGDLGGICDVCGKTFQTKAALRSHTKLHASPEGMFQCPKCPTSFRFQSRLEKHMRKHMDRTEVCPHCGKVYISKVHLQRHISVDHLGIKDYRYKCDQCGAQFFENIQLRDHIAYRHQGIQIYTCKYCHKGFNCRPTMVRHERKEHTNYLPYKCKHCSQGFPEKSKLVAHEMTHTGMSPHKCEVCCKYFTTGGALRAHKNLHLGVKPFECSACGKTYLKNWHLQQHIRKTHHQAYEVMVYNLPGPNPQGQDVAQQVPVTQNNNVLPGMDQSCMQSSEPKFLPDTMQGNYAPGQPAEGGTSLQQQSGAREAVQIMAQPLGQPQGGLGMDQ